MIAEYVKCKDRISKRKEIIYLSHIYLHSIVLNRSYIVKTHDYVNVRKTAQDFTKMHEIHTKIFATENEIYYDEFRFLTAI